MAAVGPLSCPGPLLWYAIDAVPYRWPASALISCAACDYWIVACTLLDDAHLTAPFQAAEPQR